MKFKNISPYAVYFDAPNYVADIDNYRLISHSETYGIIDTYHIGLFSWNSNDTYRVRILYKGKKTAKISHVHSHGSSTLLSKTIGSPTSNVLEDVEPNTYFYCIVFTHDAESLFMYEDEDGVSPLLRIDCNALSAGIHAIGNYITDGYSKGSYLNCIPDSMSDYVPNLDHFPEIEVVRDYKWSSNFEYIPSEFKSEFRKKCNALLPIGTIPEGTTYLATVYDRLRGRIYLPFESGEYAVISDVLPKGVPIDVGWNCVDQKLVCLYAREIIQYDIRTWEEFVVYKEDDDSAPDFFDLHVGTHNDYYKTTFIGATSTTRAIRAYKWLNMAGSDFGIYISNNTEDIPFSHAPTSSAVKFYALPDGIDAMASSPYYARSVVLKTEDGYGRGLCFDGYYPKSFTKATSTPSSVLDSYTHGSRSHSGSSDKGFDGTGSFGSTLCMYPHKDIGMTALPLQKDIYDRDARVYIWDEVDVGGSIPFDTVVFKSGSSCPPTGDYHRGRKFNPQVTIYAELYPELPYRYKPAELGLDLIDLQTPVDLSEYDPNPGDRVYYSPLPLDLWEDLSPSNSAYRKKFPLGDGTTYNLIDPCPSRALVSIFNRVTGEFKLRNNYVATVYINPADKCIYSSESGGIKPYTITVPESDELYIDSDYEILTLGHHAQFRRIDYGHQVTDPEVEFDYIRASRIDRFFMTNEVNMQPVTDNVVITSVFPSGLKIWMNNQLYLGLTTDEDGVTQEETTIQANNTHVFSLEVKSPETYDVRKEIRIKFNDTLATIVIETPPIQGANVDGLTTKTTRKSVATVCDHHQQLNPPRSKLDYVTNPYIQISKLLEVAEKNASVYVKRPLDLFKPAHEQLLSLNAIIPVVYKTHFELPSASSLQHTKLSVLCPARKIDLVYAERSAKIPKLSTDWIYLSSPRANKRAMNYWTHTTAPQPHKRAMNYWTHVDSPKPHKRSMNYWGVHVRDTSKLRNPNSWIYNDNLNHITTTMVNRIPPEHYPSHPNYWHPSWLHLYNPYHFSRSKQWVTSKSHVAYYEFEWVHRIQYDIVFAVSWMVYPPYASNFFEVDWVKGSTITKYVAATYDSVHTSRTQSIDTLGLSFVTHASIFANTVKAMQSSNFYLVNRPLDFTIRSEHHVVSRPSNAIHRVANYLPDALAKHVVEGNQNHVVYEETPQGYYATEELAYNAAIEEGYDPTQVLIMTRQYYPNAWIFSIRFARNGICPKAVEYGYVRGG